MNKPDNAGARQVLSDLLRDIRRDPTDAEIDEMISRELEKGEEMDAEFVLEALRAQEEQSATEEGAAHHAANWVAIEQKLDQQRSGSTKRKLMNPMRMAAAVLIVLALLFARTAATYALRWNFLVKVFQPVLDTLGIHMNVEDLSTSGQLKKTESSPSPDGPAEAESRFITDESKVSKSIHGVPVVPQRLPNGYAFERAEVYDDYNESDVTITYCNGEDELYVQSIVYTQDTQVAVNVLEKDAEASQNQNKLEVVENNGVTCASYISDLAYYTVWGRLSRGDIVSVITSIEGAG